MPPTTWHTSGSSEWMLKSSKASFYRDPETTLAVLHLAAVATSSDSCGTQYQQAYKHRHTAGGFGRHVAPARSVGIEVGRQKGLVRKVSGADRIFQSGCPGQVRAPQIRIVEECALKIRQSHIGIPQTVRIKVFVTQVEAGEHCPGTDKIAGKDFPFIS